MLFQSQEPLKPGKSLILLSKAGTRLVSANCELNYSAKTIQHEKWMMKSFEDQS